MSIEAMKQALEALNEVTGWTWTGPMRVMDEVEDAITALRTAIKEAEKQEPWSCPHGVDDGACKECYEQAEIKEKNI